MKKLIGVLLCVATMCVAFIAHAFSVGDVWRVHMQVEPDGVSTCMALPQFSRAAVSETALTVLEDVEHVETVIVSYDDQADAPRRISPAERGTGSIVLFGDDLARALEAQRIEILAIKTDRTVDRVEIPMHPVRLGLQKIRSQCGASAGTEPSPAKVKDRGLLFETPSVDPTSIVVVS